MTETNSDEDNYENANIVLMTEQPSENETFMLEASKSAILDTACTKTVAGEKWFINFCELLDESLLNLVEIFPTTTKFKFGDGKKADAIVKVIIPVKIADKSCKISCELVKENIPLLLSKESLKRAGAILNMQDDKVKIFNVDVQLHLSTSGHYCMEILPEKYDNFDQYNDNFQKVFYLENSLSIKEKEKQVLKIT